MWLCGTQDWLWYLYVSKIVNIAIQKKTASKQCCDKSDERKNNRNIIEDNCHSRIAPWNAHALEGLDSSDSSYSFQDSILVSYQRHTELREEKIIRKAQVVLNSESCMIPCS
jgi:hypothetical protein